jgi:ferredoxin
MVRPEDDLATSVGDQPGWLVTIDESVCIASGACIGIAPDLFVSMSGRTVVGGNLSRPDARVLDAAAICPVEAITINGSPPQPAQRP